jgi:hypothetical protein
MASAAAAAGTPSMREVRDQVLSVLLSGGGSAMHGQPHTQPYAQPYSQPYPLPHPQSPWTPGSRMSAVTWSPRPRTQPAEADVRVAELTAGLVAAGDVERRQAETIRRLAAQLERTEKKVLPAAERHARRSCREEFEEADARDLPRERRAERTPVSSSRVRNGEKLSAGKPAKVLSFATTPAKEKPARRPSKKSGGESEIDLLRRKVAELEGIGKLAEENASLRADRAAADAEAGQLAAVLADIRKTAATLVADREQLVSTIRVLREHQAKQSIQPLRLPEDTPAHQYPLRYQDPTTPVRISPDQRPPRQQMKQGAHDASPDSVQCADFGAPSDSGIINSAAIFGREPDQQQQEQQEHGSESPMEGELRAELRDVLDENSALSARISELEQAQLQLEQQSKHSQPQPPPQIDADLLEDLQAEVEILASVTECIQFDMGSEGVAHAQATLTMFDGTSASGLAHHHFQRNSNGPRSRDGIQSDEVVLQSLVLQITTIRHSIALKYGEWLYAAASGGRSDGTSSFGNGDDDLTSFSGTMSLTSDS